MPAALDVDYGAAKLIYASCGSLKRASEVTGISHDAIKQRACREEWKVQVMEAGELVSLNVTQALGNAVLQRESRQTETRDAYSQSANKLAKKYAGMDADELLIQVPMLLQATKQAALADNWQTQSVNVAFAVGDVRGSAQVPLPDDI